MTTPTRKSGIGTTPKEGQAPFYYLIYHAEGQVVAHCLNYNLVYMAEDFPRAMIGLLELLSGHIAHIISLGEKAAPVECAPDEYWEAYVEGVRLLPDFKINTRFNLPKDYKVPQPNPKGKLRVDADNGYGIRMNSQMEMAGT